MIISKRSVFLVIMPFLVLLMKLPMIMLVSMNMVISAVTWCVKANTIEVIVNRRSAFVFLYLAAGKEG